MCSLPFWPNVDSLWLISTYAPFSFHSGHSFTVKNFQFNLVDCHVSLPYSALPSASMPPGPAAEPICGTGNVPNGRGSRPNLPPQPNMRTNGAHAIVFAIQHVKAAKTLNLNFEWSFPNSDRPPGFPAGSLNLIYPDIMSDGPYFVYDSINLLQYNYTA